MAGFAQNKLIKSDRLGIYAMSIEDMKEKEFDKGFMVTGYTDDSFAKMSTIKPGDIIVGINGKPIESAMQISQALKSKDRIELKLLSNDQIKIVHIQTVRGNLTAKSIKEKDAEFIPNDRPWMGFFIKNHENKFDKEMLKDVKGGIYVKGVVDGGPAHKAGLKKGDVILKVDGNPVANMKELFQHLDYIEPDMTVQLEVYRKGKLKELEVTPSQRPELKRNDEIRTQLQQVSEENKKLRDEIEELKKAIKEKKEQ